MAFNGVTTKDWNEFAGAMEQQQQVREYMRLAMAARKRCGGNNVKYCKLCNVPISNDMYWSHHTRTETHKRRAIEPVDNRIHKSIDLCNERIFQYSYINNNAVCIMPKDFLREAGEVFLLQLFGLLESYTSLKVNFELFAEYVLVKEDIECMELKTFQSKMEVFTVNSNIHALYEEHVKKIISCIKDFQEKDSGWALTHIIRLEMNVNEYKTIRGSSYFPLPQILVKKKAIVNVKNNDEYCFKWTVIAAIKEKEKHPERYSSYGLRISEPIIKVNNILLNFEGLDFPLNPKLINKFLDKNPKISITLFGYDLQERIVIGPLFYPKDVKQHHINMMLVECEGKVRYTWIRSLSRLVRSQISASNHKQWFCNVCFNISTSEGKANRHHEVCTKKVPQLPIRINKVLRNKNYMKKVIGQPKKQNVTTYCTSEKLDNSRASTTFSDSTTDHSFKLSQPINCFLCQMNFTNIDELLEHQVKNICASDPNSPVTHRNTSNAMSVDEINEINAINGITTRNLFMPRT